ncbi:MAG: hypothetical protein ISR69_01250 [Gammaproteobacteria bacterium]|nr:hypothetical protein [Gammaproteobacteria bacterium]
MKKLELDNIDLEQKILTEGIVSATGLLPGQLQVGIKGDPSLRETAMDRCRYESEMDTVFEKIEPVLEDLLINRGIYRLFIGFNNNEIRTMSIFDPLREEIHDAGKFIDEGYIERHFPLISYAEKVEVMRLLYSNIMSSGLFKKMPKHWQSITQKRHAAWQPMTQEQIKKILQTLRVMRNLPEYYLRNFTISMVQALVRLQFNCDGTQIVTANDFDKFVEMNMP